VLRNPKFNALLQRMQDTHDKKNADYATAGNPYSNFEEAAATAGCSVDTVFAVLIGVKLARLKELVGNGKTPNNESVQDSRLDLAVYAALWASYHEAAPALTLDAVNAARQNQYAAKMIAGGLQ
jgi:hypothetical protein